jgi:hypothetical protein
MGRLLEVVAHGDRAKERRLRKALDKATTLQVRRLEAAAEHGDGETLAKALAEIGCGDLFGLLRELTPPARRRPIFD